MNRSTALSSSAHSPCPEVGEVPETVETCNRMPSRTFRTAGPREDVEETGASMRSRMIQGTILSNPGEAARIPMMMRMAGLFTMVSILLLSACASSRTYSEGILATSDTFMSAQELQDYSMKIDQEIDRVNRGGAVPAGVTRDGYLEDLKSRQTGVQTRLMMTEHFRQKDEFDDKYPAP